MHPRQQSILDFIKDFPHPYQPTVREIATGVGISSSSTVHSHLTKLVKIGLIECNPNCPRCIALTEIFI